PKFEFPAEYLSLMHNNTPPGPPATGRIFDELSVGVVFPYPRFLVAVSIDGKKIVSYDLEESDKGNIQTTAIVENVVQNQRTDERDWDEIIFATYNDSIDQGGYYQLQYN